MQKTFTWFAQNGIEYTFYDYKKTPITEVKVKEWLVQIPMEKLMNKAGTTYKKLSDAEKPTNEKEAIALLIAKPSMIKRPLIEFKQSIFVGFDEKEYLEIFG